jgi:hypothetical protein
LPLNGTRFLTGNITKKGLCDAVERGTVGNVMSMQAIPLSLAVLCVNCKMVSDAVWACPSCAGTVLINLGGILDREEKSKERSDK